MAVDRHVEFAFSGDNASANDTMSHLVIAGLRGNAGAGGAMLPLAAGFVIGYGFEIVRLGQKYSLIGREARIVLG